MIYPFLVNGRQALNKWRQINWQVSLHVSQLVMTMSY